MKCIVFIIIIVPFLYFSKKICREKIYFLSNPLNHLKFHVTQNEKLTDNIKLAYYLVIFYQKISELDKRKVLSTLLCCALLMNSYIFMTVRIKLV